MNSCSKLSRRDFIRAASGLAVVLSGCGGGSKGPEINGVIRVGSKTEEYILNMPRSNSFGYTNQPNGTTADDAEELAIISDNLEGAFAQLPVYENGVLTGETMFDVIMTDELQDVPGSRLRASEWFASNNRHYRAARTGPDNYTLYEFVGSAGNTWQEFHNRETN